MSHWKTVVITSKVVNFIYCVVPENIHTPPPHGRSLEIPRGRGVQRQKFPREVGGS